MTQAEVIKVLEREKKWMSSQEIADSINLNVETARANLTRLFKHKEVKRKLEGNKCFYFWRVG